MQFEDLDPGDEAQRYGHYLYLTAAEAVEAGEAVTVNTDGDAALLTGGDDVAGVAYIDAAAGEEVTIKTNGPVVAAVGGDAAAGLSVGSHDGTGAAGAGELGDEGDEYMVLETDGNGYALVAQRP
jgi:succinate dehydrogenase/fumarate reductase flavoprotein subunit